MQHARFSPEPREEEHSGSAMLVLSVILFLTGAVMLFLVATGKLGSQEPYAEGSLGPQASTVEVPEVVPLSVHDTLDEYTWDNLAEISDMIEAAASYEEAQAIAVEYHIMNEDGTFPANTKRVEFEDGNYFNVMVVDILHDGKANEEGMAGLAFVSTDAVAIRPMNPSGTVEGGWEGSDIRAWLNSDFVRSLPQDMQDVITPVIKLTNNQGSAYDTSAVTMTADTLYLLSAREVVGDVHWFEEEYGSGQAFWDSVVNAEGSQYKYFADAGVSQKSDPNGVLVRRFQGTATNWSYRTAFQYVFESIEGNFFYGAMESGYPYNYAAPETERGVVIGFCV